MEAASEGLVEREAPLEAIEAELARVLAGDGRLVLVEGPAGIGKSRLLAHAARLSGAAGLTVLRARGGQLEQDVTFGVTRDLFERHLHTLDAERRETVLAGSAGLAAAVIGLDPAPPTFSPETGPLHGLYWLVANLAGGEPLALIVDDAQWADAESLRALVYLARRLAGLRVLLVVAARPRESAFVDRLGGEPGVRHVVLPPLTPAGAGRVLQARLGREVGAELASACHEVTGGSPFFIGEIAEALGPGGERSGPELMAQVRALVPPAVRRSILVRLGREGEAARAVGTALAVLGQQASASLVGLVAGVEPGAVLTALDRLADVGLVSRSGAPALAHPIIRSAIYEDVSEAQRRHLHRTVADALGARGFPPEDVAQHLLLTEPDADPLVAEALTVAGRAALDRGAAVTAERLLARALAERATAQPPPALLMALAEAELASGAAPAAAEHLRAMLAGDLEPGQRTRAALMLSRVTAELEGEPTAIAELQAAAARLEGDDALRIDVESASLALYVADQTDTVQVRLAAYAALEGVSPAERVALAVTSFARGTSADARAAEVADIATRALRGDRLIAEQTTDSPIVQDPLHALQLAEALDEHDAAVQLAFADARRRGSTFGFFLSSFAALSGATLRGETGAALAHGEAALGALPDVPSRLVVKFWTSAICRFTVETLLQRGELARAQALVADHVAPETLAHGGFARGLLAAAEGDHERALAELTAYGKFAAAAGWVTHDMPWRRHAALALHALGRRDEAVAQADEGLRLAESWGAPGGLGAARRVRAVVGDPAEAARRLAEAVQTLRGSVVRLGLAEALVDQGVALREAGETTAAREALTEGMGLAARCEAVPLAERARDELRALGARPRRMTLSGVESLTASERRTAELARDGLTNREIGESLFVTTKTVETHLRQVYRKLDIASRSALAEAMG